MTSHLKNILLRLCQKHLDILLAGTEIRTSSQENERSNAKL